MLNEQNGLLVSDLTTAVGQMSVICKGGPCLITRVQEWADATTGCVNGDRRQVSHVIVESTLKL